MSRAITRAIPAVLLAGCFSVPPYEPPDKVTYVEDSAGGATVRGRTPGGLDFGMRFAGGNGFHFPDRLYVGGFADEHDVMGHSEGARCLQEDEIGVVIAPIPRISANTGALPVTSDLVPALRGPAVVQARVEWSVGLERDCSTDRTPGGVSTFTLFPDARIVRHDVLSDLNESAAPLSPGRCSCGSGGTGLFDISTFWTLRSSAFQSLYLEAEDTTPFPPVGNNGYSNTGDACVDTLSHQVTIAWREVESTNIRNRGELLAFGREMELGATSLANFTYQNTSVLLLGKDGCGPQLSRAEADNMRRPLMINENPVSPSEIDGIYGGDDGTGMVGIDVPSGAVTITGTVNTSFAVWVRFPGETDGVRASTPATTTDAWYLPQQVDARSWIIWFRDPLLGQTITLKAL